MPIRKLSEFRDTMTGPNVLLTADADGKDAVPEMSIHYNEMKPGDEVKPHIHDRVESYLFLTGRAMVMTGEDIAEVTTGDVAIAPIGIPHAIRVIGGEPLRFYSFNSPPASTCPMQPAAEEMLWKWQRNT